MTCDRPGELKGNKRQQNVKKRTVNEKRIEQNQGKEMDKNRGTKRIISQTSGREAEKGRDEWKKSNNFRSKG